MPAALFVGIAFVMPIVLMAWRSFTDPSPRNYLVFFESALYRNVLWTTIRTAALVTVVTLVLAYPYALLMHLSGKVMAAVLGLVVLLPFWSSFLVRSYAWIVLLQNSGVINSTLLDAGLIDSPIQLMRNTIGVAVGLTHIFLPFMVLPIYSTMRRVEPDLVPAANSLGAKPFVAFRRVFVPLTKPGVIAGCLLVFVLALGFYITPALLGNPRNMMYSELVELQISRLLDFGVGSALAMILLVVTGLMLAVGGRFIRVGDFIGGGTKS